MLKKIFCVLLILAKVQVLPAQDLQVSHQIHWDDSLHRVVLMDGHLHQLYGFAGGSYDQTTFASAPYFYAAEKTGNGSPFVASLVSVVTEPLPPQNQELMAETYPADFVIQSAVSYWKKEPFAGVQIGTIRRRPDGRLERLVSFTILIHPTGVSAYSRLTRGHTYASHSVLASGTWYKISVSRTGVYKIDKAFLTALGIDMSQVDPRSIRIFGNGGGMLPEANASFRYDDLQENAIFVSGEADGVFDDNDFILFYGQSPDTWQYDNSQHRFVHQKNLYTDNNDYFITFGGAPGLRIQPHPSAGGTANQQINSFNDYAFYENDASNLLATGREWYGEQFEYQPNQSFSFNFPDLLPVTSSLFVSMAARSTVSNSSFQVSVNGAAAGSGSVAPVVVCETCDFAEAGSIGGSFSSASPVLNVNLAFTPGASDANGWLNYLELNVQRNLSFTGPQMSFRSVASAASGNLSRFSINHGNNLTIWDVTDPLHPFRQQEESVSGGVLVFQAATDTLREYIAFDSSSFLAPHAVGPVANQDLHGLPENQFVIVTPASFLPAANELADYHRGLGQTTSVVLVDQIYNEFSSGHQDVSAIRDLMKMFYDRAGSNPALLPRYLLLFGDGSYDYKNRLSNNTDFVPTFCSYNSLNLANNYVTDDYFGFLDDNEGGYLDGNSSYKIDIGIGRIPADSLTEAQTVVNKILHYRTSPACLNSFRNNITFVADDEEGDDFVYSTESLTSFMKANHPVYNVDKIYLDAYKQEAAPGGDRYPDVNTAINHKIFTGTLLMNYVGHGGSVGWAHERIAGLNDFSSWTNYDKLTMFITATCDFTAFDNPAGKSAGEVVLFNPGGGAIALISTVRLVFSGGNDALNSAAISQVFNPYNGNMPTLGEIMMVAKSSGFLLSTVNTLKFGLFGDPAMTLDYPSMQVKTTLITHADTLNAVTVKGSNNSPTDTLKAFDKITMHGFVSDLSGNKLNQFNGVIYPTIFDKWVTYHNLQNDAGSPPFTFQLQKNIIYNGKATVHNGDFSFTFIVPKDIQYGYGKGKISYYASDGVALDANGYSDTIVIGGTASHYAADNAGPEMKLYMNNDKFVYGGITDPNPVIYLQLKDASGINITGNSLGHDITGVLDGNVQQTFSMNDFYEANQDDYGGGTVHYPLYSLASGSHTLTTKAWDIYNNSAEATTEFVVADNAQLALSHVLNYPNPFSNHTEFMFEENMPGSELDVKIEIYSIAGRLVKTIRQQVVPDGYRVDGIAWDGRDDYGDNIGKGVYVYRVEVRNSDGLMAQQFEKLVLLR